MRADTKKCPNCKKMSKYEIGLSRDGDNINCEHCYADLDTGKLSDWHLVEVEAKRKKKISKRLDKIADQGMTTEGWRELIGIVKDLVNEMKEN